MYLDQDENGTCTIVVLKDFGEEVADYNNIEFHSSSPCAKDFKQFVERLEVKIKDFNEYQLEDLDYYEPESDEAEALRFHNRAVIQAATIRQQPLAEGFLEEFGFNRLGPFEKGKHPQTKLSIWWLHIPEFMKKLEAHKISLGLK